MATSTPTGTVFITGGNGGLGSAFIDQFLNSPHASSHQLLCTVRNLKRVPDLDKIISQHATRTFKPLILPLDLTSLAGVRTFAADVNHRIASNTLAPISILILNAAVQDNNGQVYTGDGFERVFAVDYLANFLLVLLLLPSLDKEARIIIISSTTHDPANKTNKPFRLPTEMFNSVEGMAKPEKDEEGKEWLEGMRRYAGAKLAMIMFLYELQRRLSASSTFSSISVLALDPGGMPQTSMILKAPAAQRIFIYYFLGYIITPIMGAINSKNPMLRTAKRSATDLMYAAFDVNELGKCPKGLTLDGRVKMTTSVESRDNNKQVILWNESVKLLGLHGNDFHLEL